MFVTTHPSARQYLILTILCTLLASTFSRKRRLCFEQILTPIYKNWFAFGTGAQSDAPTSWCEQGKGNWDLAVCYQS